jgi:protein TonB
VLASGRVGTASVVDSSGHEVLDDAALEAVRAWLFVPAHLGEFAVDSTVDVPIEWKLVE